MKISIIIPAYNAEKYISRCIDSWLNQTYSNFELIIINDGSTDNTQKICENYKQKDNRIILIKTENYGVSHARNIGLDNTHGDFIGFCDADDYVHPQLLETLSNIYIHFKSNIMIFKYKRVPDLPYQIAKYTNTLNKVRILNSKKLIDYIYCKNNKIIWNKFFKRENILSLKFNEKLTYGEDLNWLMKVIMNNIEENNIAYISKILYYYVINQNSATMCLDKKFNDNGELKVISTLELNQQEYKNICCVNIYNYILSDLFVASLANCFLAKKNHIIIENHVLNKLHLYLKKYYKFYFKNPRIPIINKIKCLIKLIYIKF